MSAEQPFQYQKYADVTRETEKLAFELVLHILRSGLVWAIWLERVAEWEAVRRERADHLRFLELVYKLFRLYGPERFPALSHFGRLEKVAARMSEHGRRLSIHEVAAAVVEAEREGIPETV